MQKDPDKSSTPLRLPCWSRQFRFSTQDIQYPTNVSEVVSIVQNAKGKVRVLGTGHSFNKIADSEDTLLSIVFLNQILKFDKSVPSVTVEAGVSYGALMNYLDKKGFRLANNPGANDISVVGATQTGTHGSGIAIGNVATQIRSLQIVLPSGDVATYTKQDPELKAMALGLGLFGVITQVELDVLPIYKYVEHIFMGLPEKELFEHFNEIQEIGQCMSLFTNFEDPSVWTHFWIRMPADHDTIGDVPELFGAKRATSPVHLGDVQGAAEWKIPYELAVDALKALSKCEKIRSLIKAIGLRGTESDDMWMSPSYGIRIISLEVFWATKDLGVIDLTEAIKMIDQLMKPFNVRPHWGKAFCLEPSYYLKYFPKHKEFIELADKLDPEKKFRNEFVNKNIFSE
ncbi:FAD binding domain-containing protein [Ditylenchus destructor]|uniref:FAD binding domain-containing protein n=1 Tax=Ditylenchus destructor TaxID=166010 RepID=A0AAD4ML39_9BILA|nr:FAD binding domain-containing protein [Ditylenchus destructor]